MVEDLISRIENDFISHKVDAEQVLTMESVRHRAKELALFIASNVPRCREQSTALSKLEEVMFWTNAGISRYA